MSFLARDMLNLSPDEILVQLPVRLTLQFDDGEGIETTRRKVAYSRYCWEIHKAYPKTPLLRRHFVESSLKGEPLTSDTLRNLLSIIFNDTATANGLVVPESKEHLLDMVYTIVNQVHNNVSKFAEENVGSIDILDFIEVQDHPVIRNAVESVKPTHQSIYVMYDVIKDVLKKDPGLANNSLVKAIKAKMVNMDQVLQCIGTRGFLTEVDGSILPIPVMTNYTNGLNGLYEYVAESRGAAKALYFSEAPLQDAEYFARRLQLLSMVVERIDYVDCGTTRHMEWRIKGPEFSEKGDKVYDGDLLFMTGKYYLDEETGRYKEIAGDDPSLYGKVLKIRTPLFCQHKDPHSVCEVCFGGLSRNVSRYANIGHLCAATMTQQTSQSVLSTKHIVHSASSNNIELGEVARQYFATNSARNSYLLRKDLKHKEIYLVVNRDEAPGLTDILNIDIAEDINPLRVSSIEVVELRYKDGDEMVSIPIFVNQGNRRAILTAQFLQFLKIHRWETDANHNFVFNLSNWNPANPILRLPDMEYSYSDHSHQIAKMIESSMKNITDRQKPLSNVSTLQELFTLVNSKLNVNIVALEILIYALTVPNKEQFGMGRNSPDATLGIAELSIKNRSLGPAYAYEEQLATITSPASFFKNDRPSSIFDVFVAPEEVVNEWRSKQH